jgi:hypothetical protein
MDRRRNIEIRPNYADKRTSTTSKSSGLGGKIFDPIFVDLGCSK